MRRALLSGLLALVMMTAMVFVAAAKPLPQTATDPQVQDAVTGILAKFDTHPVVAIGEHRGLQQLGDLYKAIIRHPDFATKVGNLVMEYGNAHHQAVIDRYVNGEDVAPEELERVWSPTIAHGGAPVPLIYKEVYQTVREVNLTLPAEQRIRVWLGEPPFSPDTPPARDENGRPVLPDRDAHFAGVIMDNILSQGKKTLAIIGAIHLLPNGYPAMPQPNGYPAMPQPGEPGGPVVMQRPVGGNGSVPPIPGGQTGAAPVKVAPGQVGQPPVITPLNGDNVKQILEANYPGQTYVVRPHTGLAEPECNAELESGMANWPTLAFAEIANTWLQALFSREDCHDLLQSDTTWGDGYVYLGPIASLTMSTTSADETPETFLEAYQKFRQGVRLGE